MTTKFKHDGHLFPVVLAGTVSADDMDVVGTGILGVAVTDGVSGDTINYVISGAVDLVKVTGAVIAAGELVLFDVSAGNIDDDAATPASGDFLCGMAMEAAGSGVLVCEVLINVGHPTVT